MTYAPGIGDESRVWWRPGVTFPIMFTRVVIANMLVFFTFADQSKLFCDVNGGLLSIRYARRFNGHWRDVDVIKDAFQCMIDVCSKWLCIAYSTDSLLNIFMSMAIQTPPNDFHSLEWKYVLMTSLNIGFDVVLYYVVYHYTIESLQRPFVGI